VATARAVGANRLAARADRYGGIAGLLGIAAAVAWTVYWAVYCVHGSGLSWHFFVAGARRMVGLHYPGYPLPGGVHLYANYPRLQIGPLSFLVALPLALLPKVASQPIAIVLMTVIGGVSIWLVADAAQRLRQWTRGETIRAGVLAWVFVAPLWFQLAITFGHFDDVLALLLLSAAVNALARGHGTTAALCIGAAASAKPWAIATIPLALAVTDGKRIRHLAEALLAAVVPWLPFVLGDSHTLRAGTFKIRVVATSVLALFHVTGGTPGWVRPVQFFGGALLVVACVWSGRWAAAVVIAVAVRLGTDPNVYTYYATGLVVGAAIWDLLGSRLRVPLLTAVGFVSLYWSTFWSLSAHTLALLRLVTVLAIPLLVLATTDPELLSPT
jgi:hypothetical protein